ncbi:MAG: PAS domain S-box protein [Candidatus Methanoperedens sp.]|nr:PAS domain S-box protein [Candidatus Methanoperedens sp.]MCE8425952.1 PAS domain S-box protein [Candidatus Methanoperedens sp.]MCE8427381.1 PAS domain S-box protein [Candidatus Methanoperedens sp.]
MVKKEYSKLKALSDIASIDIDLPFETILQNILRITCVGMNANSGTMMLFEGDEKVLKMVASYGLPYNYIELVNEAREKAGVTLTSSPSGVVLETGKYYLVPNVYEEPRARPWMHLAKISGILSQIFTPMKRGSEVIGLLNIYMAVPYQFTEEEIDFVMIAASQASSVVQNARLCSHLRDKILDLTDYKENLELNLKRSETRYKEIFENAHDSMYTYDINGYFLDVNKTGLEAFGCSREELIGTHVSKWLTPESFKLFLDLVSKIYKGEKLQQPVMIEVICKNGEHRWGEIRISLIKEGDKVIGTHGITRDVTDKIRLEQQLIEYHKKLEKSYEELKETDRIKTEFISIITHELLTPLTSIKGFTELLFDGTSGQINEEQRKSLEIIKRNSDRLIRLIRELLDVSNLDKNKLGLQFELVSMNDIISRAIMDIHPQSKTKEISIIQNIPQFPHIWGDKEKLMQVITNLLANAIKFTLPGGMIKITGYEDVNGLNICVTDTGIGIPPDKVDRIFDRFYQIDSSNNRRYGGMGLGLSICKSVLEKHYGSIRARSSGKGSTFHIILPKLVSQSGRILTTDR